MRAGWVIAAALVGWVAWPGPFPALAAPPAPGRPAPRVAPLVALWDLRTVGVEEGRLARVTGELQAALARTGFQMLAPQDMKAKLLSARVSFGASMPEVAAALNVKWLFTGTLAGLGDELSLDLKLFDGRDGKEVRRVAINLPANAGAEAVLDELLVRLLQPERWAGSLALEVAVDGAQVTLDGVAVATTPLREPLGGLHPGKHILMISREGYGEYSGFVVIKYDQTVRLKIDLKNAMVVGLLYEEKKAKPTPPPKPKVEPVVVLEEEPGWGTGKTIAFWGMLGGVAVAGGGLVVGLTVMDLETSVEQRRWSSTETDRNELANLYKRGQARARWTNGLVIAGGALAATGLVLFLVLPDEDPGVAISPLPLAGGAGLSVTGRF